MWYQLWHHNPHKRLSWLSSCTWTPLQQKPLPRVSFCMLQCSFVVAEYFLCLSQYEYHSILPCLPMDNKEEETPCAESNFYSEIIRSLLLAKNVFFGKQKLDVKQLKKNKFIFDVKQLKMNRFIKSISDLIISTSNATLEVPSLRPCLSNSLLTEITILISIFSSWNFLVTKCKPSLSSISKMVSKLTWSCPWICPIFVFCSLFAIFLYNMVV